MDIWVSDKVEEKLRKEGWTIPVRPKEGPVFFKDKDFGIIKKGGLIFSIGYLVYALITFSISKILESIGWYIFHLPGLLISWWISFILNIDPSYEYNLYFYRIMVLTINFLWYFILGALLFLIIKE